MFGSPGRQAILRLGASSNNMMMTANSFAMIRTAARAFSFGTLPKQAQLQSQQIQRPIINQFFNHNNPQWLPLLLRPTPSSAFAIAARGYATATKQRKTSPAAAERKAQAAALKKEKAKAREQVKKEKLRAKEQLKKEKAAAQKEKKKIKEDAKKEREKLRKEKAKAKAAAAAAKAKEKAATKAKAKKSKLQPWELLDEQGNKVPLPTESRPRRPSVITTYVKQLTEQAKTTGEKVPSVLGIAQQYRELPTSTRAEIKAETDRLTEQFHRDFKNWEASLTSQDHARIAAYRKYQNSPAKRKGSNRPIGVRTRDPTKPSRPVGAFFHFLAEKRKGTDKLSGQPLSVSQKFIQDIAQEYRDLPPDRKSVYESTAARELDQYKREMEKWRSETGLA